MALISIKNTNPYTVSGDYVEVFIPPEIWKTLQLIGPYIDVKYNDTLLKFYADYIDNYERTALLLVKLETTDGDIIEIPANSTIILELADSSTNNALAVNRLEYMIYGYPFRKQPHAYTENPLDFANNFLLNNAGITLVMNAGGEQIEYVVSTLHETDTETVKSSWRFEKNRETIRIYHYEGTNSYDWLEYKTILPSTPRIVAFLYTTRWMVFTGYSRQNFEYYTGDLPLDYSMPNVREKYGYATDVESFVTFAGQSKNMFWRFYNTTLEEAELKALGNANGIIPLFHVANGCQKIYMTNVYNISGSTQQQLKNIQKPVGASRQSLVDGYPTLQVNGETFNPLASGSAQGNAETQQGLQRVDEPVGKTRQKLQKEGNILNAETFNSLSDTSFVVVGSTKNILGKGVRTVATAFNSLGNKWTVSGAINNLLMNPMWIELWYLQDYAITFEEDIPYKIELYPEEGLGMAFVLEQGNTGFYKAHITNSDGDNIDADSYEAILYNDSRQPIANLPVTHIGTGWYNITVKSDELCLEEGKYHLEFKAQVAGYQILRREYLYIRFNA